MSEKLKVVITDDEPKVCVVVQKCVHWEDLELELVGTAHNGKELLDKILETKPDLVITDIDMPEMNGLELIETVRKAEIKCKFIIISGYRQFEYAHKALKNNVEDYLLKPIDEQELNESLERLKIAILHERMQDTNEVTELITKNKKDKENIQRLFLTQMMAGSQNFQLNAAWIEFEYARLIEAGAQNIHISTTEHVVDTSGKYTNEDGTPYQYQGHFSWIYFDNNDTACDECGISAWEFIANELNAK